jgi:hypothetical protein
MAKIQKTLPTSTAVMDYIQTHVAEPMLPDILQLITLFEQASGYAAMMWGSSIIGFGSYSYTYASEHSGTTMLVGFSPRAKAISLYLFCDLAANVELLASLGKFKAAKSCLYIKKTADIDLAVLEKLIKNSIGATLEKHPLAQ